MEFVVRTVGLTYWMQPGDLFFHQLTCSIRLLALDWRANESDIEVRLVDLSLWIRFPT